MYLYHTTSIADAAKIIQDNALRPRDADGYVSISERPILRGDIRQHGAVIVLDHEKLKGIEKVRYDESWYEEHQAQAAYIAGEGWEQQYNAPDYLFEPPDDWDEEADGEWEPDEDALEDDRKVAEIEAFEQKRDEREWITREAGEDLELPPGTIVKIGVPEAHLQHAREVFGSIPVVVDSTLTGELVREACVAIVRTTRCEP